MKILVRIGLKRAEQIFCLCLIMRLLAITKWYFYLCFVAQKKFILPNLGQVQVPSLAKKKNK